ncbi:MAG: efflux RND transporter periplasmic adaptor subunit [Planctomycetota bacterium]
MRFLYTLGLTIPAVFSAAQVPVRVAPVRHERLQQRHEVTGTLRAVARGDIAALEPGRLLHLNPREGDQVASGEIIARVDDRRLQARRAQLVADAGVAEANRSTSRAKSKLAAADLRRAELLLGKNAISQKELDRYRFEAEVTLAEVDASERTLDSIQRQIEFVDVQLSDTVVLAPYDATVVQRHVETGDWVAAGEKILTIVSTGPIEAWIEVPERFAGYLDASTDPLGVQTLASRQSLNVLSLRRVADVDPRARTMHYVVTVGNPDAMLVPGMSASAWVPSGESRMQLTVPKDAIMRSAGGATVFRVADAKAIQTPVRILYETHDRVVIQSGEMSVGMPIVVEGNERLRDNALVTVQDQRTTANPMLAGYQSTPRRSRQ